MTVLGLHCFVQSFLVVARGTPLLQCWAPCCRGLSCCGAQALGAGASAAAARGSALRSAAPGCLGLCGCGTGLSYVAACELFPDQEPLSPALAGRFLATVYQGCPDYPFLI